jgi:hypothetical protein
LVTLPPHADRDKFQYEIVVGLSPHATLISQKTRSSESSVELPSHRPIPRAIFCRRAAMKVVLLGTGGYIPTSQRQTSCLLLPESGIVLDAGTGMSRIADYRRTERLDIFLSHAHLDHIAGLTYLINVLPPEVVRNTIVRGEAAKLRAVREHLFAELVFPVAPVFPISAACRSLSVARRRDVVPFSSAASGRLDWLPARLAGTFAGLCHRYDCPSRCGLREPDWWRQFAHP